MNQPILSNMRNAPGWHALLAIGATSVGWVLLLRLLAAALFVDPLPLAATMRMLGYVALQELQILAQILTFIFLAFGLMKLRRNRSGKYSDRPSPAWAIVLASLLSLACILNLTDFAYYCWSQHKIDLVFLHNLGWSSTLHLLRTAQALYAPPLVWLSITIFVSIPIVLFMWFRRQSAALIVGMSSILQTWKWFPSALVILAPSLIIAAMGPTQASARRSIRGDSLALQQLGEHPAFSLWEQAIRRLAVAEQLLSTSALREEMAFLKDYFQDREAHRYVEDLADSLPFVRKSMSPCQSAGDCPRVFRSQERPLNVVLIIVESFAASALAKYPDYFPNMQALRKEGVYFDKFFANTFQTANGLVAILCSAYPNHGERFTRTGLANPLLCMSDILHERGYHTAFLTGSSLVYDDMKEFVHRHGFDEVFSWESDPESEMAGSWGLHDSRLFSEMVQRARRAPEGKPFFLTALTISTHPPFEIARQHKVDGLEHLTIATKQRDYLQALNYFDQELGRFVAEMRELPSFDDTVFVVTGDHAIDWENNALDLFHAPIRKDTMWLPLLMFGKPLQNPGRVESIVGSQVDIAPTLLTQLGINTINSFWGNHLFDPSYSGYALYFNHYQNNFLGMIESDRLHRFELPVFVRTEHLDNGEIVSLDEDLNRRRFVNATFRVYNNLLFRYKVWDPALVTRE